MKSAKNIIIVFLMLAVVGVSALAWQQYQELIGLRAAALQGDERAALQKNAWDAQKRIAQLEREATAREEAMKVSTPLGGESGKDANQSRAVNSMASGMASMMKMMDNPDVQRLMALQQKAQLNGRYAALFKSLHLSTDQLAQFKNLLVEKQMVNTDVMIAATQQGINPMQNPKEFRDMMQATQSDIDTKIKSTLGDDGYAQFQNYQQTQGQRNVVTQLEQSLSYTETPLTSAQSDQMLQILSSQTSPTGAAGAQIVIAGPGGGPSPMGGGAGSRITDATIASAQGVLSPPQVQALQEIQQQQQAQQQLARVMMQNQRQSGSTGPIPAPGGG